MSPSSGGVSELQPSFNNVTIFSIPLEGNYSMNSCRIRPLALNVSHEMSTMMNVVRDWIIVLTTAAT